MEGIPRKNQNQRDLTLSRVMRKVVKALFLQGSLGHLLVLAEKLTKIQA
jgi:hypothetical protein